MINSYSNALARFLKMKRVFIIFNKKREIHMAFVIIGISGLMIFYIGKSLQSELAPLEDRSLLRMQCLAPEGTSYEAMGSFMEGVTQFINDSIPEKKVLISVTSPTFAGTGAVNTGYFRIVFPDPADRTRSQQQIADYINRDLRFFPGAKAFVLQEQTISIGTASKIGFPVRFVLQAANFDKLREYLPRFMDSVAKDTANFLGFDSDLKFNKPELVVTIDRERAKTLGISVLDIAQIGR